jgi:hypothetical protein
MPDHKPFFIACLISLMSCMTASDLTACSMFKITLDGKTMVGNNEDAWSLNSRIWFEKGEEGKYGVAYVGHNRGVPQGGLNEAGLAYDAFSLPYREAKVVAGKKGIPDNSSFLKKLMQKCGNVHEVKNLLENYNLGAFSMGMFWFIDKSGDYLILEGDSLMMGNDSAYVLVNFRPSETTDLDDIRISRFQKGRRFLQSHEDTTVAFCAAMMDTMRASRGNLGHGTLYTSIYDLNAGIIYLYFYQDFSHQHKFNLKEELAKGDHSISMPGLFPPNTGYQRLEAYKTPMNSRAIRTFLIFSLAFFILVSFYGFTSFIQGLFNRKSAGTWFDGIKLLFLLNNAGLLVLIPILWMREPVFYFGMEGSLVNFPFPEVEYIPILSLFLSLLLGVFTLYLISKKHWGRVSRILSVAQCLLYGIFTVLFLYWDLMIPK